MNVLEEFLTILTTATIRYAGYLIAAVYSFPRNAVHGVTTNFDHRSKQNPA